ncbi:hypothetical protein ACHHYP_17202 [Achlya hypogyna]|uniref:Uncharacterized protein n=1 Tax=Achlya hypogyna TaxID=1202772 RepID=A0A1V9ZDG2_ACHHY|nr:hypothetical protein ACHHYP_17202 [Achlya hypogyna]
MGWEDLYMTQEENLQLRADLADAQLELARLRAWKEDAVKLMTSWAPKRMKLEKEKAATRRLQKRLLDMERELQERAALSEMLADMKEQDAQLMERQLKLMHANDTLKTSLAAEVEAHTQTRRQLTEVEDGLSTLVDRLLGVREALDTQLPRCDQVSGLLRLGAKCADWLEAHAGERTEDAAATAAQQQQATAAADALARALDARAADAARLASALEAATAEAADLRQQLSSATASAGAEQAEAARTAQRARRGKALLEGLLQLVRQHLHAIHVEVKRKFGYLPDAIAAPNAWARVSEELHAFERFLAELPSETNPPRL